jgi:hypothetical protein
MATLSVMELLARTPSHWQQLAESVAIQSVQMMLSKEC